MSLVRGALGDFGVVFKVANSYWLSSNFQHFLTRLSYVCPIPHREYAKDGMVRFQRAYHHGCSPTFVTRVHDSASRECEGL